MYQLYIANKNYSSWSMRPWLVLKAFDLPFEEIMLPFPAERNTGTFKQDVLAINPNGKVPVLIDQDVLLWDSLAICEYLAEQLHSRHCGQQSASYAHMHVVFLPKCTVALLICAVTVA